MQLFSRIELRPAIVTCMSEGVCIDFYLQDSSLIPLFGSAEDLNVGCEQPLCDPKITLGAENLRRAHEGEITANFRKLLPVALVQITNSYILS